ncbi:hypothetical protein B0H14DRAFT_1662289 [Mycena olivaceomarginata]|nr:hypothetical protein B0H14DRAFT_1662289 [Mycena olivaceomarginata]
MSSTGQSPKFSVLYQYALVGAVAIVGILVVLLCFRARVVERRRRLNEPSRAPEDIERKPRLYDAYLDVEPGGVFWHDVMPISLHPVGASPGPNPGKHTSLDVPLTSALSTVAVIIAMPIPNPPQSRPLPPPGPTGDGGLEEEPLPYLEIGVADVEVPRESQ